MYLDRIIGSKTKVNALAVLIENPNRSILEIELAKDAGSSVSEINRQMGDMVNSGLVRMERVGKAKVYQINQNHFLYKSLKSLFRNLQSVYREIAFKVTRYAVKKHEIKAVILFGSLARGRIDKDTHRKYLDMASELHLAGYTQGVEFKEADLKKNLQFAEDLLTKVKAAVSK